MTPTPVFRLYLWSHRVLYLGVSPDNDLHRHHAAQLCVSLDGPLNYRSDRQSSWASSQGILIPPDHPHQLDAGDATLLALYLEPESDDYPLVHSDGDILPLALNAAAIGALRSLIVGRVDAGHAWSVCASVLDLGANRLPTKGADPRVRSVIDLIRSRPNQAFTARKLAAVVHISPSRLSHLFKHEVGVPIRRFIVWSRLRTVIKRALQGNSLTEAAHAAGFSDAAHMSNAFRQMFGFAPSALFTTDVPKNVVIVD